MYQVKLPSEQIEAICRAVEQANARLLEIEKANLLSSTQYAARLSWEALYEAREILHMAQRTIAKQPQKCLSRSVVALPIKEFLNLAYSTEKVMINLQKIEMEQDIVSMKKIGRQCQQVLGGCLSGACNRQRLLSIADLERCL